MSYIIYSTAKIGDNYAPSLNGAFEQIYKESHIKPIVLSPLGGERTLAQERSVGGDANSDHYKKRAVDISNQRQLRNWNEQRFIKIMNNHGWYNVTESGKDFSEKEPWHWANQSNNPLNGTTNIESNEDMPIIVILQGDPMNRTFRVSERKIYAHPDAETRNIDGYDYPGIPTLPHSPVDFARMLQNHGLAGIVFNGGYNPDALPTRLPAPGKTSVSDDLGVIHTY